MAAYSRLVQMAFSGQTTCATWGTGPVGTLGDGCVDEAEWTTAALLTVACVAAVYIGTGPLANRAAGTLLAASSAYHVLYGEGHMGIAIDTAADGDVFHGVMLGLLNTREVTVVALTWAVTVAATCCGDVSPCLRFALWFYGVWAGVCAAGAHSEMPAIDRMLVAFDTVGVVLGVAVFRATADA